ncbi:hypothetical protein MJD09_17795 [bacterium]|nr:hypothetical protein [bacterium]
MQEAEVLIFVSLRSRMDLAQLDGELARSFSDQSHPTAPVPTIEEVMHPALGANPQ